MRVTVVGRRLREILLGYHTKEPSWAYWHEPCRSDDVMLPEAEKARFLDSASVAALVETKLDTPELRLMAEVLLLAIFDSTRPLKPWLKSDNAHRLTEQDRAAARAWLRGAGFTAHECCLALGIDYDAMMKKLEERWTEPEPESA